MNNKGNRSQNSGFLILLIIILGFSTYYFYSESRKTPTEEDIENYIKSEMRIDDVINIYGKSDFANYVSNNYSPYDFFDDVINLNDLYWDEIASEGYRDRAGEELWQFFDRKVYESEQQQKQIEEMARIMRENGINPDELTEYQFWTKVIELQEKGIIK